MNSLIKNNIKNINSSNHTKKRMQQRGIDELMVLLLEIFGEDKYQKGGSDAVYIPKKEIHNLRKAIDKIENLILIKGDKGKYKTVMHKTKRLKVA